MYHLSFLMRPALPSYEMPPWAAALWCRYRNIALVGVLQDPNHLGFCEHGNMDSPSSNIPGTLRRHLLSELRSGVLSSSPGGCMNTFPGESAFVSVSSTGSYLQYLPGGMP